MTDRRPIRTFLAEDEVPTRKAMRGLLDEDDEIEVVGEAWGTAALDAVRELVPELLLLDVRMPGLDGFELLRCLEPDETPFVVFVTAYDEYAVDAFEVRAIDYLLKPFTDDRFRTSMDRAKARVRRGESGTAAAAFGRARDSREGRSSEVALSRFTDDHLVLRDGSRLLSIPHGDITWIEASGVYVQIHTDRRTHLVRCSMKELVHLLKPRGFHRIHRSAIVNLAAVREVQPLTHGDCLVQLADGLKLKLSRSRRESFEARFP